MTMPELSAELAAASGTKADPASLSRWLIRNGYSPWMASAQPIPAGLGRRRPDSGARRDLDKPGLDVRG
jgi:hypothetical protein